MPAELIRLLEALLPESKKSLRVLALFLENPREAYTRYMVEKLTATDKVGAVLERFCELRILEIIDEEPRAYRLNLNNSLVQSLLRLIEQA